MSENYENSTSTCIRCGRCCKHFSVFGRVTRDEWPRLLDHVMACNGDRLRVWQLDRGLQRFVARDLALSLNDIKPGSGSELFHPRNNVFNRCPFLHFDFNDAAFSCEIHGLIKPRECISFYCEGSDRFGVEMEYCDPCWIHDVETNMLGTDHEDKTPPCEIGKGCRDFTHRILFFLAYAKRHPVDPILESHALYLLDLIEKNNAAFAIELESKGLDLEAIQANLGPLAELKLFLGRLCDAGKKILDLE